MMNLQDKRKMSESRNIMKIKMSKFREKIRRMLEFKKMMNPQMKRKITLHHSMYFSKTYILESPSKYGY
jgi:hypothetical protein